MNLISTVLRNRKIWIGIVLAGIIGYLLGIKYGYRQVISEPGVSYEQTITDTAHGYCVEQEIIPTNDRVDEIQVGASLACEDSGYLDIHLREQDGQTIFERQIPFQELPADGWKTIIEDVSVEAGRKYILALESKETQGNGATLSFLSAETGTSVETEGNTMYYAHFPINDATLKMKIIYKVPIKWYEMSIYCIFILLVFMWFSECIKRHRRN